MMRASLGSLGTSRTRILRRSRLRRRSEAAVLRVTCLAVAWGGHRLSH
jgi:hypothetical protein